MDPGPGSKHMHVMTNVWPATRRVAAAEAARVLPDQKTLGFTQIQEIYGVLKRARFRGFRDNYFVS